jgi:hypothetical protein
LNWFEHVIPESTNQTPAADPSQRYAEVRECHLLPVMIWNIRSGGTTHREQKYSLPSQQKLVTGYFADPDQ